MRFMAIPAGASAAMRKRSFFGDAPAPTLISPGSRQLQSTDDRVASTMTANHATMISDPNPVPCAQTKGRRICSYLHRPSLSLSSKAERDQWTGLEWPEHGAGRTGRTLRPPEPAPQHRGGRRRQERADNRVSNNRPSAIVVPELTDNLRRCRRPSAHRRSEHQTRHRDDLTGSRPSPG